MPRKKSVEIALTLKEKRFLNSWHNREGYRRRDMLRAQIILCAGRGETNYHIAKKFKISRNTVKLWRFRFFRHRLDGLKTRPIPGRPKRQYDYEISCTELGF